MQGNTKSFFIEKVAELKSGINEEVIVYISGLIERNISTSKLIKEDFLLSEKYLRNDEILELSEYSLFIAGFYPMSFENKIIDLEYYENISRNSYLKLNNRLFKEVAMNIKEIRIILNKISIDLNITKPNLMFLTERYNKDKDIFWYNEIKKMTPDFR
tara:strand:+ start:1518 stop:1991 length:474 start_codon:yes stop_codon:yes gene_type:complete